MGIRVIHSSIGDLADDLRDIAVSAPAEMTRIVKKDIRRGRDLTRTFARESAGAHGKFYPPAIEDRMTGPTRGEWGPNPDHPDGQGGMSFEGGSRNQPPHLDHAKAADIVAPELADDVNDMVDGHFW